VGHFWRAAKNLQPCAFGTSVEDDELLAERQILCDQIGPLGEQGTDDGSDEPQQEHRHLSSS